MAQDSNYLEAIAVWSNQDCDQELVAVWFKQRNLTVIPMQAGLLVSGAIENFEAAFSLQLLGKPLPIDLPLPTDLSRDLESITIPSPPKYS